MLKTPWSVLRPFATHYAWTTRIFVIGLPTLRPSNSVWLLSFPPSAAGSLWAEDSFKESARSNFVKHCQLRLSTAVLAPSVVFRPFLLKVSASHRLRITFVFRPHLEPWLSCLVDFRSARASRLLVPCSCVDYRSLFIATLFQISISPIFLTQGTPTLKSA